MSDIRLDLVRNGLTGSAEFTIVRTTGIFQNLNITQSSATLISPLTLIFRLVNIQNLSITITNINFDVDCWILGTTDPLSAYISFVTINLDWATGGFQFNSICNYPEAYLNGTIIFENNIGLMNSIGVGFLNSIFTF